MQLASSATTDHAVPLVQLGDTVTAQPITAPLLPASSIMLRQLMSDDSGSTDTTSLADTPPAWSKNNSSFQAAIDGFISAALTNSPCHVGMTVSVELFSSTKQLVIGAIEPAPSAADPASPPAVYIVSANTTVTMSRTQRPGCHQPANSGHSSSRLLSAHNGSRNTRLSAAPAHLLYSG